MGLLDGKPSILLAKEYDCDMSEIESLLHGALIMVSKVTRFCEQIGWTAMERMLKEFKEHLNLVAIGTNNSTNSAHNSDTNKHLYALLAIPMMPRKIAKVLVDNRVTDIDAFVSAPPESVVQIIQLSIGFELQVGYLNACFLYDSTD